MEQIRFLDDGGTFALNNPEAVSYLYFPLASETGLKSAITPRLGGDSKLDQERKAAGRLRGDRRNRRRSASPAARTIAS